MIRREWTTVTKKLNNNVQFERYMTLTDIDGRKIHYELVSLMAASGRTLESGHYYAYVLSPSKEWIKLDDNREPFPYKVADIMKEERATAYTFFYRKIQGSVTKEVADLFVDTYGANFHSTAVAMKLPLATQTGKPTPKCLQIIDKFKQFIQDNPNSTIIDFIRPNKIELHFWRYYTKDSQCYKSCVPNGTCGFQLDFLLHERETQQDSAVQRDFYIKKETKHINTPQMMKDFLTHIKNKAYGQYPYPYFPDLVRPKIVVEKNKNNKNPIQNTNKPNTYKSYEDWIYHRWKMNLSKEIDDHTYAEELTFYKYHEAAEWIINNSSEKSFRDNIYDKQIKIKDLKINLWFGVSMFNYCKKAHKFSIFYNTKNITAPYIPDHYILCYSTINDEATFNYLYDQLLLVAEDLNHGALDEAEHFFLLYTMLFGSSLNKSLEFYLITL